LLRGQTDTLTGEQTPLKNDICFPQHNICGRCAGNTAAAAISATVAEIGAAMVAAPISATAVLIAAAAAFVTSMRTSHSYIHEYTVR